MDIPTVIGIFLLLLKSNKALYLNGKDNNEDPECFGNFPLCNSTLQYPEENIRNLLKRYRRRYNPMFGTVIEPMPKIDNTLFRSSIEVEEETLCKTKKVNVMPRTAYDQNMQKRYIVNLDNHLQSVTFETCAETKCFGSDKLDTLSLRTSCQQRYSIVRLLYFNEEKNTIEYGKFSIPSTCVCTYNKLIRL